MPRPNSQHGDEAAFTRRLRRSRPGKLASIFLLALMTGCGLTPPLDNPITKPTPDEFTSGRDDSRSRPIGYNARLPDPSGPARPLQAIVISGSGQFHGLGRGTTPGAKTASEKRYTLNLLNVSIPEAAKAVMGDILNINYIVDPRLDSKVTVQTSKPGSQSEVVDLFLAALRTVGAVVVQNGEVYRVIGADQMATTTARLGPNTTGRPPPVVGAASKIISLKYISPTEMRRILEPM